MRLDYAILAQQAEFTPDGRMHVFGGGIDTINAQTLPAVFPNLTLVMRFIFSESESGRPVTVRISGINPSGGVLQPGVDLPIMPVGAVPEFGFGMCFHIQPAIFPAVGEYFYRIEHEGQEMARLPLRVRLIQPPQQQTPRGLN